MPNNNNLSISSNVPVIVGVEGKFHSGWYNFFAAVLLRARILNTTTTDSATAGAASALPAAPAGYLDCNHPVTGAAIKVPYYNP